MAGFSVDQWLIRYPWRMNRMQKFAVAITIAATIGLTGCSSTAEPTPDATPEVSLAETVQDNLDEWYSQEEFPNGIPLDDLLFALTEIEDVSDGTIRAYVQYDLSDAEREAVANSVHGLGYTEDLKVVVVRDVSGLDSNHFFY